MTNPSGPPPALAPAASPRYVVITGGSSGIGRALSRQLAAEGADVLVAARRPGANGIPHRVVDLASLASVRAFADRLRADDRPIDTLVLGAGVHVPWKALTTRDGHELQWQVNYLSNLLLTHLLLDLCRRSARKQVVCMASEAHRLAALRPAALLGFWRRYAASKQAAISYFLRLQGLQPELRVQIVSPGYVDTEIHSHKRRTTVRLERALSRPRSPAAAAAEIARIIEQFQPGCPYWDRGRPATPSRRCFDDQHAAALWRASVEALRSHLPDAAPCEPVTTSRSV